MHQVMLLRYLPKELQTIIDPVIQWNSYFCHPENILIAMLADNRDYVRVLTLGRIIKYSISRNLCVRPS